MTYREPHLLAAVARLYDLPGPPGHLHLESLAEPWRPSRTWVAVLIRAGASRILEAEADV